MGLKHGGISFYLENVKIAYDWICQHLYIYKNWYNLNRLANIPIHKEEKKCCHICIK